MARRPFGTTADGTEVDRITLDNGEISASILTFGATLQDLRLAGLDRSLTLGSPRLADYEDGGALYYFGAVVGPVANRILHATTELDGTRLDFEANGAGGHCLHSGAVGLHRKVWQVDEMTDRSLRLTCTADDGEGGFPGNRRFAARFTLEGDALGLTLTAETDAPTLMNLANHSYWNLGDGADFHGQRLQIAADAMLPTDATDIATGEIRPVDGTPYDFRNSRALTPGDVIDHNFCLSRARVPVRPVATVTAPDGLAMVVETTEPGLQVYDCRHLPAAGVPGLDGRRYGNRAGLALEAQFWPDAPSHPAFPSIRLAPGQPWEQHTRWRFVRP